MFVTFDAIYKLQKCYLQHNMGTNSQKKRIIEQPTHSNQGRSQMEELAMHGGRLLAEDVDEDAEDDRYQGTY
jgi:hypothetical protein